MALSTLLLSYINTVVAGNYRHVGATRWRGCGAATVAGSRRQAADSPVGDKNKAPGLVKVSERAKGDI